MKKINSFREFVSAVLEERPIYYCTGDATGKIEEPFECKEDINWNEINGIMNGIEKGKWFVRGMDLGYYKVLRDQCNIEEIAQYIGRDMWVIFGSFDSYPTSEFCKIGEKVL